MLSITKTCSAAETRVPNGDLAARYDLVPNYPVPRASIQQGYEALANVVLKSSLVRIDGYVGVDWLQFERALADACARQGRVVAFMRTADDFKSSGEIEALAEPFLGGDDPLFGTRCTLELADFFHSSDSRYATTSAGADCIILMGCGAGLVDWAGPLIYVDLPKYELQLRSRRGEVQNLGMSHPIDSKSQYKRFYFIDWPLLNRHKRNLINLIDWFVDAQTASTPTFIAGDLLRRTLDTVAENVFRVVPWFEPGPWGGQWIKNRISQLPQNVPNYAWSFELITPENGLAFCDGINRIELSFDWLMFQNSKQVLGDSAERFGDDFPIRFDFLDTMSGGNLSLQCHPRPDYIRDNFGELFTQDETYYILDCDEEANVYLGFRSGVDPQEFRAALEHSEATGELLAVETFVNCLPAERHDLFLIPSGTIHCSGTGNLVLEISATPYIFTFKMYDWQRLGLDGKPRPLNIERAFENLQFDRDTAAIEAAFISHPVLVAYGVDWQLVHLPTHPEHFYDVERCEFDSVVAGDTQDSPLVMMLVEGTSIVVSTSAREQEFHYAETFVIPAAAGKFTITNRGSRRAKVVVAFIKSVQHDYVPRFVTKR